MRNSRSAHQWRRSPHAIDRRWPRRYWQLRGFSWDQATAAKCHNHCGILQQRSRLRSDDHFV